MKIAGHELDGKPHEDILPLPHHDAILPIRAQAIQDFDEFHALCPEPKAPGKLTKDGWVPDENDTAYKDMVSSYNKRRLGWMVVTSLQDIEWDSVDSSNPSTWTKWEEDLRKGGLSQVQCNLIFQHVMQVNCLDETKLQEARKVFRLGQAQTQSESSSPQVEQPSTQSGEPASE